MELSSEWSTRSPELNLPVQGFVLGSALGTLIAAIRYHLTGDLDRWPLIVGYFALLASASAYWEQFSEEYAETDG